MGIFDKKNCDICGGKIGLLGNRKLEDGNLCKDCAKNLSPFFSERRKSTIADINNHLAYREANKAAVTAFNATRTLGKGTKVFLDEDAGKFLVTSARKMDEGNPDVLDFSQVTGCVLDVSDYKTEQKQKDKDGKQVSYVPPRFIYNYDFNFTIQVNHPWFTEINFKVNNQSVHSEETTRGADAGRNTNDYRECEALANEIKEALTHIRQTSRETKAAVPKVALKCPGCGATCIPDANGRCEYYGGPMIA